MGLIQRLPQDVVNRMAAGEVLARPYNAIKELVENSLDAGATEVMVNMQNGGLKLLQVTDNGKGIEREDFELVCERFATSKLVKFEDLMHMKTYGFRGEALASLSHVAKVHIVSKRADANCAYQADYLDGKMIAPTKPSAGKNGTVITATDLFYNLPTRRNKMATHGEEAKMVYDTLLRFAIHRPDVQFSLRQNQSSYFRTKGDGNFRDVVSNLMGRDIADTIVPLSLDSSRLKFQFSGHFSKPIAAATAKNALHKKTTRSFFSVFINGRSVRCDILKHPMDDVLQNRSLICQFCSVHLQIDETRIDVNVHPTKSSVIFLEKEEIVQEIRAYFEKVVNEVFGISNLEGVQKESQEDVKEENLADAFSKIPVFMTQSIKSIEAIRRPSTSSESKWAGTLKSSTSNSSFNSKNEKKRVDYMEVRTDSKERSLDEFIIRCPQNSEQKRAEKRPRVVDLEGTNGKEENEEQEEEGHRIGTEFDEVSMVSMTSTVDGRNESQDLGEDEEKTPNQPTHRDFTFESLESIRKKIVSETSLSLREMFKTCIFVGSVDPENVLIQFGTSLYSIDFSVVLNEFFYQMAVFSFGNFGSYRLIDEQPPVTEMLELLAELGKGDENYKAFRVFEDAEKRKDAEKLLAEHLELLHDYFSIKMEWNGEGEEKKLRVTEIPSLVHCYVPQIEKLPFLVAALILQVDYDDEAACFDSICHSIGDFFTIHTSFVTADDRISAFSAMFWKALIKEILFPIIKRKLLPPENFKERKAIRQLADAHDLYKVFERCGT